LAGQLRPSGKQEKPRCAASSDACLTLPEKSAGSETWSPKILELGPPPAASVTRHLLLGVMNQQSQRETPPKNYIPPGGMGPIGKDKGGVFYIEGVVLAG